MTDSQKQAVYDWEDSFWGWYHNVVPLKKCREVIQFASGLYGVEPPTVRSHRKVSMSWSIPQYRRISLQSVGQKGPTYGGLNIPTALHEVSHQIVWDYYGDTVEDHGPEFVGVYVWLLSEAGMAPAAALYASLDEAEIRYRMSPPNTMPSKREPSQLVVGEAAPSLLLR